MGIAPRQHESKIAIDGITERLLKADRASSSLFTLGRELSKITSDRSSFRRWLIAKYEQADNDETARRLESILIEVPDEQVIWLMIEHYAATGRRFDGNLRHAIENVVLKHVQLPDWQDAYELTGEPVAPLRKRLFAITLSA